MIIAKIFDFEASHQLPNEDCYGMCRMLHGHRYELIIKVSGAVMKKGWVCNFSEIKKIVQIKVIDVLDHSHLNNTIELPTAENILFWINNHIKKDIENIGVDLHSLKLYETARSYAELIC